MWGTHVRLLGWRAMTNVQRDVAKARDIRAYHVSIGYDRGASCALPNNTNTRQLPGCCGSKQGEGGGCRAPGRKSLLRDDVLGLWAFLAVCDRELDFLAVG